MRIRGALPMRAVYVALCALYLGAIAWHHELRWDHVLVCAAIAPYLGPPRARRIADLFAPLALTGVLYDAQRLWDPYLHVAVHVSGPYHIEKLLFGIPTSHGRETLNEILLRHTSAVADVVSAIPYATYIFLAVGFGMVLCFVDPERATRFGWAFFAMNVAGMLTEAIFPVAPPWYVERYGLGPVTQHVAASAALATRFDALTGTSFFHGLYARATDVFGAIPSLHVAYPALLYLYCRDFGRPRLAAFMLGYGAVMAFAAVYLQHHYLLDVVIGVGYACAAYYAERAVTVRREEAMAFAT